jgi:hypothetical protein
MYILICFWSNIELITPCTGDCFLNKIDLCWAKYELCMSGKYTKRLYVFSNKDNGKFSMCVVIYCNLELVRGWFIYGAWAISLFSDNITTYIARHISKTASRTTSMGYLDSIQ